MAQVVLEASPEIAVTVLSLPLRVQRREPPHLALVEFADGTRIRLEGDSAVDRITSDPAKRVVLRSGSLWVEAARQPAGRPMICETPQAEACVLGTVFSLKVDGESTRLEVREGKVRLTRLRDRRSVVVLSGQYAVAAPGVELAARPLPIDQIVLLPRDVRERGGEWTLARDGQASSGSALEAARTNYRIRRLPTGFEYEPLRGRPAAIFTFAADGDKDYFVWMRGRSTAKDQNELKNNEVALEFLNARLSRRCPDVGRTSESAFVYSFPPHAGYGWVCGYAESRSEGRPLYVRFAQGGQQVLRLYAVEAPVRIDAIWLSATQKTRPSAEQGPPRAEDR